MPEFSVVIMPEFATKVPVCKLVRNGRCRYDDFIDSLQGTNQEHELGSIFSIVEDLAEGKLLPKNKYRRLKLSKKLKYKGYEAKSKHLRVYLFHDEDTGHIIAIGGTKGDQDEDIERFEKILKDYERFKAGLI